MICDILDSFSIESIEEEMEKLRSEVVYADIESSVLEEKLREIKNQIRELKEKKTKSLEKLTRFSDHYNTRIFSNKEGA